MKDQCRIKLNHCRTSLDFGKGGLGAVDAAHTDEWKLPLGPQICFGQHAG